MDSSKKGNDWMEAKKPISPGPACSSSTATIGTAAKLSCSADCASKLDIARRRNEIDNIETDQKVMASNQVECSQLILGGPFKPPCRQSGKTGHCQPGVQLFWHPVEKRRAHRRMMGCW
jgi:hypothetical protein